MQSGAILDGNPNPPTLGDILRIRAEADGDTIAIRFEDRTTSYTELCAAAMRVGNALRAEGLVAGDRIAILAKNGDRFFELLFGAAVAGIVLVPINWRLSAVEIGFILADSTAAMLFVDTDSEALAGDALDASGVAVRRISLGDDFIRWRDNASAGDPHIPVDPHDIVLQLYTSGTTGRPKGALLTHHSLNSVRVSQPVDMEWCQWSADDVCLISMPLFHVGGIGTALAALYHGARMVIAREFTPEALFDYVERDRITKLFLVPAAMRIVLDHPRAQSTDYRRIKYILYGSSPISAPLLQEAMTVFGCGFVQVYGMTETSGTIVALAPEDHDGAHMTSAGRPLAGVDIAIVDAAGKLLPIGAIGEVAVRSAANMAGYWRLPEASAAAFTLDGFLLSGDLGSIDADGYLTIHDRVKDMIISGGENVYAAEVESVLCAHPAVAEAAVIGVPDPKWGEVVKAVVVLADGADVAPDALALFARGKLAAYKVPRIFDFAESLPKNAAGKILRRMLR